MKKSVAISVSFTLLIAVAVFMGCGGDDSPVSSTTSSRAAAPPPVNPRLVGSWYRVGSYDGLLFNDDGSFRDLASYGDRFVLGYDGGEFSTRDSTLFVWWWEPTTSPGWDHVDTLRYTLSDDALTLNLTPVSTVTRDYGLFERRAIGKPVIP